MASVQNALRQWIAPKLTALGVGVERVGLLYVPKQDQNGKALTCSIVVPAAAFETRNYHNEVAVTTQIALAFVYEPFVELAQSKKDKIYQFFLDELHGFSGLWPGLAGEPDEYRVELALLTSYGQQIEEDTGVTAESYNISVKHAALRAS